MQGFVVQPEFGHRADVGGFNEEVGGLEEAQEQVASSRVGGVAGDPALASGVGGPVDRFVGMIGEERGDIAAG